MFTLGIDLGKTTFHLVGMSLGGGGGIAANDFLECSCCTLPRT